MATTITLFLFIFCSHIWATGYSRKMNQPSNPLNGQHLRVIWPLWSGNPKGLPGPLKGGVILECLATRFNFTYEMVRVTEYSVEPSTNGKGLLNYLRNQQCDLLLQDVVASAVYKYQPVIDTTVPWVYTTSALLTHIPDDTLNINAVIKPFQWPIWLGMGISIVCVISVLKFLQRYHEKQFESNAVNLNHGDGSRLPRKQRSEKQFDYVIGNLLAQGYPSTSKRLPFRIVAGVWTVAAFIFVQAYNSTLLTYVLTPINNPLVNSPYEIPERKDVHLLIRKGGSTDIVLSNSIVSNTTYLLYKKLGERINSIPESRCFPVSQCVSMLIAGSNNIFMDGLNYHKDIIREEFKKTGKCNLQILAKEGFSTVMGSFALQKNSEYTKIVNQGLLEMAQAGLFDYWELWFRPVPPQCQENIKTAKPVDSKFLKTKDKPPALTFKNLTGAFIVLLFGLSLSFLTFLCELITTIPKQHKGRFQKAEINSVNAEENTQDMPVVNAEVENESLGNSAFNRLAKRNQNEPTVSQEDDLLENELIKLSQNIRGSETKIITVEIHDQNQHHDSRISEII